MVLIKLGVWQGQIQDLRGAAAGGCDELAGSLDGNEDMVMEDKHF